MAIVDKIDSIKTHLGEAYASLEEKGATIPENKNIENLADSILTISASEDLDTELNEQEILLDTQTISIEDIQIALIDKSTPKGKMQEKKIATNGVYTPDEGYDGFNKVTVNVAGGGGSILPSEYQEVEYIESTGTQYISTEILSETITELEFKFTPNYISDWASYLAGNLDDFTIGSTSKATGIYFRMNGAEAYKSDTGISTGAINIVSIKNGYIYINDYHRGSYASFGRGIVHIFNNASKNRFSAIKVYNLKIKGDDYDKEFIPCYRKSDNAIGLYEESENKFYPNNGTGVFLKGADVEPQSPLQEKEIEITENGVTEIIADEGYSSLAKVTVTTNVEGGSTDFPYAEDGLVALWDNTCPVDSNGHWLNKYGDDYIYRGYHALGYADTYNKLPKQDDKMTILTNTMESGYLMSKDYLLNGYTIEIVGRLEGINNRSAGGWLITANMSGATGIGIRDTASTSTPNISFYNADISGGRTNLITLGEWFGATLNFENVGENPRSTASVPYVLNASINGNPLDRLTSASGSHSSKGNSMCLLAYYYNDYRVAGGIKCIRIYNRKLTNEEVAHNHQIDVERFNLNN